MKILVTGATGFLGKTLVPILLDQGHDITALVRSENKIKNFSWWNKLELCIYDILSTASVPDVGPQDAIIHLSWSGLPNYNALYHIERNLPADYRFLKTLIQRGINQVLVTGTCLEYGMQSGCLSENINSQPITAYGLAKDTLRKFLECLKKEINFNLQWARLFYLHGPGQNPSSLLPQLERALANNEKMFNMSDGNQERDYLHVHDAAEKIARLLAHPQCNGIVNICSGTPISVKKLVDDFLRQQTEKIQLNLGFYPHPDYEPGSFWGDNSKYNFYCKEK